MPAPQRRTSRCRDRFIRIAIRIPIRIESWNPRPTTGRSPYGSSFDPAFVPILQTAPVQTRAAAAGPLVRAVRIALRRREHVDDRVDACGRVGLEVASDRRAVAVLDGA